jgi:hypothetical protein
VAQAEGSQQTLVVTEVVAAPSRLTPAVRVVLGIGAAFAMWSAAWVLLVLGVFAEGIGPAHAGDTPPPAWFRPTTFVGAAALVVCSGPLAALLGGRRWLIGLSAVPVVAAALVVLVAEPNWPL